MKGQGKRFLNHKGKPYGFNFKKKSKEDDDESIGFFDLWRYASLSERLVTCVAVLLSWLCSCGLVGAIVVYGELTSLLVQRHKAQGTTGGVYILTLFGGGEIVSSANRTVYMDALVDDSRAFALASCAIMALQLSTAAVAITIANWAAGRMVSRLRCQLLRAALRQELAFFDTNKSFNFAAVITEDMDKIRLGAGSHVVMCGYLVGSVAAAAGTGLALGWQLTLAGLSVVPLATLAAAKTAKYQTRYSSREVSAYSAAGRVVQEALAGVRTVRAYGGEEVEVDRYVSLLKPAMEAARRRGLVSGIGSGLGWLLTYALNAVVLSYGARLCVRDMDLPPEHMEYHPGVLVTILFCTFMAAQNIAMCHPHLEIFSSARASAGAVYRVLQRRSRIDALARGGERVAALRGDVLFDNVYFSYPSRPDVKVLRGLTLSVRAGSTVALVGSSGCGKSTVLQLLQRLYEPAQGAVSVDGRPLDKLDLHHYRTSIGVVGQEPVLFSGTIRENITLGMRDVTQEQLVAAATIARAHHFISKLADGYDTQLGERGAQLSGGQKQRIAIARAIIRQPAMLLLDEPTSALDPTSERQVQAALDAASEGRTTLVVSHRLSTIVNATSIVYMEQGAVVEQGTYTELLEKRGAFWRLLQADMTSKSAMAASLAESSHEEEDEVFPSAVPQPFHRALSVRSSRNECSTPERCIRGSKRFGSVSSAHIPNVATPDLLEHVESEEPEQCAPAGPEPTTWQLLRLNAPEWPLLAGGGASSFVLGATMPAFALLFSKIYGMFGSSDPEYILSQSALYAALFAGVAALCGVVTFLQAWLFNLAGTKLTRRLRRDTFTAVLKQEQGWLDLPSNSVGAVCARLATDCAAIQGATGTRLGTVLQGVSTMVIGVTLAMCYSWKMTLVSLISVPCVMVGIYMEGYIMQQSAAAERRAMERASKLATEAIINIRTVHSLSVEESLLVRYESALQAAATQSSAASRVRGPVYGLCLCAPTLGYAVSLAYGGYLVAREAMPYEYAILVSEALIYGAWMLAEALSFAPNFAAARRSGARILSVLNREPAIVSEPTAEDDPHWSAQGDISYNSVTFHYPSRPSAPVLRGLNLRVEPGRTVALVGASGCGKSTLTQLLMRTYEPSGGAVELDGKDIKRSLSLPRLRAQVGLVQQEPVLFERSIRENIAYGDNSRPVTMEEVVAAARQANIHSFISTLPLGYETNLGSGGADLSGGQKQRIAIARALVRNPKILLLDEATSALDANSEKVVQAALETAARGRTTIVIAHRLATVQHADTIAVIDNGVVAEQGSHSELVRRRGLYYELLQQQAPSDTASPHP